MEGRTPRKKSPPRAQRPTESPTLLREFIRTRYALLELNSAYTYGRILLQRDLPAVAALLSATAKSADGDALALGTLLREQGAPHTVELSLHDTPYRLLEDADSHAPVVAVRLLNDRIRDEKSLYAHLCAAAERAVTEQARQALAEAAEHTKERMAAMEGMRTRLTTS